MVEVLLKRPGQEIVKEPNPPKTTPEFDAAFKLEMKKFYSSLTGKFVVLLKEEGPSSQSDIFIKLRIEKKWQEEYMRRLEEKGILEREERGNKFLVKGVHMEKVEKMIKENLYDRELTELIKQKPGMDAEQIFYYVETPSSTIDKRLQKLRRFGLVKAVKPFQNIKRYFYFSPDFIREGETGAETRKRVAEQIKETKRKFEDEKKNKLNFKKI